MHIVAISDKEYPTKIIAKLADKSTKGLIDLQHNYLRVHSYQTLAYGITYNVTKEHNFSYCR